MPDMNTCKSIRKSTGKSQADFAIGINRSQASVSRWERGDSSPTLEDLRAMHRYLSHLGVAWNDEWIFPEAPKEVSVVRNVEAAE